MTWPQLDEQMAAWSTRLVSEVKVSDADSRKLATIIASEVRFLSVASKAEITASSPVRLADRLQELQAFQGWMDIVRRSASSPFVVRAQVITQNYISFVYLPEFLASEFSQRLLRPDRVRANARSFLAMVTFARFGNVIAHANWSYREDFNAIGYWARKGNDPQEKLERFEVIQEGFRFGNLLVAA